MTITEERYVLCARYLFLSHLITYSILPTYLQKNRAFSQLYFANKVTTCLCDLFHYARAESPESSFQVPNVMHDVTR